MKISIDFDGTLSTAKGMELARKLIVDGNELYIITRRRKTFDEPVYNVAQELKIPRNRVIFTNGEMKWKSILKYGIELHIDNNPDELKLIDENTEAETQLFTNG